MLISRQTNTLSYRNPIFSDSEEEDFALSNEEVFVYFLSVSDKLKDFGRFLVLFVAWLWKLCDK